MSDTWCHLTFIYSILFYLFILLFYSIILFIYSIILFIYSIILFIYSIILFIYSIILFIYSIILFIYSIILFIYSIILFIYSIILFIYSNSEQNARLDVAANGVWGGRFERTFFDVRVFNPFAKSNMDTPLATTYRRHENDKRRQYEQRVIQVEHSSFVPLVFSATGGMSKSTSNFYRHLALKLSMKRDEHLSVILSLLHCRLSFALLRAAIMCIRGVRSSRHKPLLNSPFDLQVAESRLSFS